MAKGRPTVYRDEHAVQVYKLCLLGATDVELADFFGIAESTLHLWVKRHPAFSESRARGKMAADAEVADKLYQRALGFSHPEVHVSTYEGDVTLTPITKQYPPDTQAASWWLKNRQPSKWKDKTEAELSGPGGGPIQSEHRIVFVDAKVSE
jgi:hypothetical protein